MCLSYPWLRVLGSHNINGFNRMFNGPQMTLIGRDYHRFSYINEIKPKSVIRLFCANETFFLSSVLSLLGYNGTPLRPQSGKTSVQK